MDKFGENFRREFMTEVSMICPKKKFCIEYILRLYEKSDYYALHRKISGIDKSSVALFCEFGDNEIEVNCMQIMYKSRKYQS